MPQPGKRLAAVCQIAICAALLLTVPFLESARASTDAPGQAGTRAQDVRERAPEILAASQELRRTLIVDAFESYRKWLGSVAILEIFTSAIKEAPQKTRDDLKEITDKYQAAGVPEAKAEWLKAYNGIVAELEPDDLALKLSDGTPLWWAAVTISKYNKDTTALPVLLKLGANVDSRDDQGRTALFLATDSPELTKLLLDKGADPNARDKSGSTALHDAAYRGDQGVIRLLLERKADVNAVAQDGHTPLRAVLYGTPNEGQESTTVARMLLDKGADVNFAKDGTVLTPLMITAYRGLPGHAKLLLGRKAKVNATDENGLTPLMVAAYNDSEAVARLLLDAKADLRATDSADGWTALMIAASSGSTRTAKLLLARGANPDFVNPKGVTALILAAYEDRAGIVTALLDKGAKAGRTDPNNITPLMYAAEHGSMAALKILGARGGKLGALPDPAADASLRCSYDLIMQSAPDRPQACQECVRRFTAQAGEATEAKKKARNLTNASWCALYAGDANGADRLAGQALDLDEDQKSSVAVQGHAQLLRGEKVRAVATYRKYVELMGGIVTSRYRNAWTGNRGLDELRIDRAMLRLSYPDQPALFDGVFEELDK